MIETGTAIMLSAFRKTSGPTGACFGRDVAIKMRKDEFIPTASSR